MRLTEKERQEIMVRLTQKISDFISDEVSDGHTLGFLPDNVETLMASAAFSVLMATHETNVYIEENAS